MKIQKRKIGPTMQKVLLLLGGGLTLGFTHDPRAFRKIRQDIAREWNEIDRRALLDAIAVLYASRLVDYKEHDDGTFTLTLTKDGKKESLRYRMDDMKLEEQKKWDGMWRMVLFDIPEHKKKERDILSSKLKQLGFFCVQKSVFLYPFRCENEVNFIVEFFNLRPYVRMFLVKETDINLHLKKKFGIR